MSPGLDALLGRMRQEASEQVSGILADARAGAERSTEEARTAATWERSKYLSDWESRLRSDSEATLEKLRREARQELLVARLTAVAEVLERATALAPELLGHPEYVARVRWDIDRAVQVIGGLGGGLTVPSRLVEEVRAGLPSSVALSGDDSLIGFRLQSADGRVRVEQTIEELLRRRAPELRIAAAAALDREVQE